jgi:hypothetical protein
VQLAADCPATRWELALHAIDLVTLAMDFDHGAAADEVIAGMLPLASAQAPDRPGEEHAAVCRWVLENLINVRSLVGGQRCY